MNQKRNQQIDSEPIFFDGPVELRSKQDGTGHVIHGYYALFNTRSREMRTAKGVRFIEIIAPGALDKTDFADIESRFNHELIIAAPPTLRHGVDSRGGWYEIDYDPEDPDHVSVARKIQRGDSKGSSFEFKPPSKSDQVVTDEAGVKIRRIKHIPKVYEVGPVLAPAYRETTAFVRSINSAHDQELEDQQKFEIKKIEAKKFLAKALS